jgi:ethanolamine utilization protein EutA (predicted chaperonin)
VPSVHFSTDAKGNAPVITQFQYQDVGISFDIRDVHDVGRLLTLNLTADVNTIGETVVPGTNDRQTTLRHNQWESELLIPIGKPTVVFKSVDFDSKGSMQVLVTATLLQ